MYYCINVCMYWFSVVADIILGLVLYGHFGSVQLYGQHNGVHVRSVLIFELTPFYIPSLACRANICYRTVVHFCPRCSMSLIVLVFLHTLCGACAVLRRCAIGIVLRFVRFARFLLALRFVLDSSVDLQIYIWSPSKTEAKFITNQWTCRLGHSSWPVENLLAPWMHSGGTQNRILDFFKRHKVAPGIVFSEIWWFRAPFRRPLDFEGSPK